MDKTVIFLIVLVLAIAIFDVYIIKTKGKFYSISAYIIRGSKKMPLVTLLGGIVLGHLFWSMDSFDHLPKEELINRCQDLLEVHVVK